jgi:predicted permease
MKLILVVLPAFLIFGTGFIGQKILKLNVKSISTMALYLMMPFLTFHTFYTNKLSKEYLYVILFNILLIPILAIITYITGKIIKTDKKNLSAMLLGTAFPNMGNYGAPVALFAFGPTGFNYAIITMVVQTVFINTIGVFIAAYGGEKSMSVREALQNMVKMPVLYGVIVGFIFQISHIALPSNLLQSINLVGSAAVPTVMIVLGMQLAEVKAEKLEWKYVYSISIMRLVISPIAAALFVSVMPISTTLRDVFILLSAMPIAANTTLLAVQFDTKPNMVSFLTLITTLISLISIPITLHFL